MGMCDFTEEETLTLVSEGFRPGWIGDMKEGDVLCIPPVSRHSFSDEPEKDVQFVVVERIERSDGSYIDEGGGFVANVVYNFIGTNEAGLPQHYSYGSVYNCFIF